MPDTVIIGGGVVGLSLARVLAQRGCRVTVLDREAMGQEASWAGAGILPPANGATATTAEEKLAALSTSLHAQWSAELRESTGIDNGYRTCGGLYVADESRLHSLDAEATLHQQRNISVRRLTRAEIIQLEPALAASDPSRVTGGYLLPDEAQLRNPWHLQALIADCQQRGVELRPNVRFAGFLRQGSRCAGIQTDDGVLAAEQYCCSTGAWTGELLRGCGWVVPLVPNRGQIALLRCPVPPLRHIVNEGRRYLVPRYDGRVLVGSTEEDVGFDKRTTSTGIAGLLRLAQELAPPLAAAEVERTWAGLRPRTPDGLPILGRLPGVESVYVAAGHSRAGLLLSTGTAIVMSQLMLGETPRVDLSPFCIERFGDHRQSQLECGAP